MVNGPYGEKWCQFVASHWKNLYPRGYNIEDRNNNKMSFAEFFKSNAIYFCRLAVFLFLRLLLFILKLELIVSFTDN